MKTIPNLLSTFLKRKQRVSFSSLLFTLLVSISILFLSSCVGVNTSNTNSDDDDLYSSSKTTKVVESDKINTSEQKSDLLENTESEKSTQRTINPESVQKYRTDDPEYKDKEYKDNDEKVTYENKEYYYDNDDYYDYSYSSRIRRFHSPYAGFGYYDNCYTNYYWYNYDPYSWGVSIYSSYPWWWGPSYSYNYYDPYYSYGPSFSVSLGFPYLYGSYHHGSGYSGYGHGYYHGYSDGLYYGHYNKWVNNETSYYNSYDKNSYYHYGPSDARSSSAVNVNNERPILSKTSGRLAKDTQRNNLPGRSGGRENGSDVRPERSGTSDENTSNQNSTTDVRGTTDSRQLKYSAESQGRPGRPYSRYDNKTSPEYQKASTPVQRDPANAGVYTPRPSGRPVRDNRDNSNSDHGNNSTYSSPQNGNSNTYRNNSDRSTQQSPSRGGSNGSRPSRAPSRTDSHSNDGYRAPSGSNDSGSRPSGGFSSPSPSRGNSSPSPSPAPSQSGGSRGSRKGGR